MEIHEFSFPISSPNYSPIDSPPLWQISPSASPTPSYGGATRKGYDEFPWSSVLENYGNLISPRTRRSCSFLEGSCLLKRSKMRDNDDEDEQEEKMDMLWEDLEEESCENRVERSSKSIELHHFSKRSDDQMLEIGCVPTSFKLVKSGNSKRSSSVHNIKGGFGNVVKSSNKKPSMVVLMKVLRKFFALQQSSKKGTR